jgi:hypothetical protein
MKQSLKQLANNFIKGCGSILDITGISYDPKPYIKSDAEALRSDWETVGNDMSKAIRKYDTNSTTQ